MFNKKEIKSTAKKFGFSKKAIYSKNKYNNKYCYTYVNERSFLVFDKDSYTLKIDNVEEMKNFITDDNILVIIRNCEKLIELENKFRNIRVKIILKFNYKSDFIDIELLYNQNYNNNNKVGCLITLPYHRSFSYFYNRLISYEFNDYQLLKVSKIGVKECFTFIAENDTFRNQINFNNIQKEIFLKELTVYEMISL